MKMFIKIDYIDADTPSTELWAGTRDATGGSNIVFWWCTAFDLEKLHFLEMKNCLISLRR